MFAAFWKAMLFPAFSLLIVNFCVLFEITKLSHIIALNFIGGILVFLFGILRARFITGPTPPG